jgi:hypothetical protein
MEKVDTGVRNLQDCRPLQKVKYGQSRTHVVLER